MERRVDGTRARARACVCVCVCLCITRVLILSRTSRSHFVEKSCWERLCTCRNTDYITNWKLVFVVYFTCFVHRIPFCCVKKK